LIKYLVDSLQSYETSHGDALRPVQHDAEKAFCGEEGLTNLVTSAEFREVCASSDRKFSLQFKELCDLTDYKLTLLMDTLSSKQVETGPIRTQACPTTIYSSPYSSSSSSPSQPPSSPEEPSAALPSTSAEPPSAPDDLPNQSGSPPALHIPNLRHGENAWRDALKQWQEGDREKGLLVPLKDWPNN
jgi:hypothetical protein